MKKRGEIGVFDAEQYFAGIENQRLRINGSPGDDELDDEAQAADADGSLPLSPLPDLYSCGKARHMDTKQNQPKFDDEGQHVQGNKNVLRAPAPLQTANIDHNILPHRALLQPSPALSHRANPLPPESAADKSLPQDKNSTHNKPQAFSPSMRLASFLARFKLSYKSKSTLPSATATTSASSAQQANTPPKSSFFSNASSQTFNSKPPSPRGRFMRALSSSSSQNLRIKTLSQMKHHSGIAASTPISPAGSDLYSSITHSASTTPTSYKNPRSHLQTHVPISPSASLDWRRNADNAGSRRSLGTHIPFMRRKLRDYLMMEKSPRHHQDHNQQQAARNKQEKMTPNRNGHQQGMNKNGIASYKQSVGINRMASNHGPHQVRQSNGDGEKQRRASNGAVHNTDQMPVGETTATPVPQNGQQRGANSMQSAHNPQGRDAKSMQSSLNPQRRDANSLQPALDPQHRNANSMQSQAHMAQAVAVTTDSIKQSSAKEIQRQMDWARRRMQAGQEVEDDIEVAERLLMRVAREHQASALSTHNQASSYTTSYKKKINVSKSKKGGMNRGGFGEQGSGLAAENGGASRRSRKSSSISPFSSSAARYNNGIHASTKEEYAAGAYDSESSSDLFEIETLQAFSYVAGLYRPRDLPVYDTKSPRHTSK